MVKSNDFKAKRLLTDSIDGAQEVLYLYYYHINTCINLNRYNNSGQKETPTGVPRVPGAPEGPEGPVSPCKNRETTATLTQLRT